MDVQSLRWFQHVADGVTVTEVADLEMVSQPSVTRALQRLESEVGAPLLRREGRLLRMTHAGSAFKRHLDSVLHHLDDAIAAAQQSLDPDAGTVSISVDPTAGISLLPRLLADFSRERPRVALELHACDAGADLAWTAADAGARNAEWLAVAREPTRLLVPSEHPLAEVSGLRLSRAAGERFVALGPASSLSAHANRLCLEAGFEPQVVLHAPDLAGLRAMVSAGLGVALAPSGGGATGVVELQLAEAGAYREVGLGCSPTARLLPAAKALVEWVRVWHPAATAEGHSGGGGGI